MEKKIIRQNIVVIPNSKAEENSLQAYFNSFKYDESLVELSHILSSIFENLYDQCIIKTVDEVPRKGIFNFDCYFKYSDMHIGLSLSQDFNNKIISVDLGNEKKSFLYNRFNENDLILSSETKRNDNTNNEYIRSYYNYGAKFYLKINDFTLSLSLWPNGNKASTELITYDNEFILEDYLLNLTLPIDLTKVHEDICSILNLDLKNIEKYDLILSDGNKESNKKDEIISYRFGNVDLINLHTDSKEMVITDEFLRCIYDEKTSITINEDGSILVTSSYDSLDKIHDSVLYFLTSTTRNDIEKLLGRLAPQKKEQKQKKIPPYKFD